MSALSEPTVAWEPVTPRGVAAFARASFGRLFFFQALVALLAAAAVFWFLEAGILPTLNAAIDALPDQGQIHHQQLEWHGESPLLLAEGNLLAFTVDLNHGGEIRSPADFQFEFGTNSVRILSLFDPDELAYPPDYEPHTVIPFNRPDLRPLWDAWRPDLVGALLVATFLGLLLTWFVLATLYSIPAWIIGFFCHRRMNLLAAWRLSGAALLPGAILVSLGLVAYVLGICDVLQFLFLFGLHFVVGWVYLFVAPMFLERAGPKTAKGNPFASK